MTVESAVYIDTLNSAYPPGTDAKKEGDDHLRLIKAVLKSSFPNVNGALGFLQDGTKLTFPSSFRILGDFNNATVADRSLFQCSVVNGATGVGCIPNGTAVGSNFSSYAKSDPDNSAFAQMAIDNSSMYLVSGKIGTGSYVPMQFLVGNAVAFSLGATGAPTFNMGGNSFFTISSTTVAANLTLNANGYKPFMRANGTTTAMEWVNSANTYTTMTLSDAGTFQLGYSLANYNKCVIKNYGPSFGAGILMQPVNDSAPSALFFCNAAGTGVGQISTNGTNTAYGTSSDYRLKKNVLDLTGFVERIMAIRPVQFDWISDDTHSFGFLAHELQAVEPQAVSGEKDAIWIDYNGNEGPQYQNVDNSFLVPDLTAMCQYLKSELDKALQRIATLEGAAS